MKRYMLFLGREYYPGGGWSDFYSAYDLIEEAKNAASVPEKDWAEIVDSHYLCVVSTWSQRVGWDV